MSKITKVNGDYRLQVQTGGNIILDTGNAGTTGNIIVYGNLNVKGATTYVETNNVDVNLNLLYLNVGDNGSGTGISSSLNYQAGIVIDRGTNNGTPSGTKLTTAQFLYNDNISHYDSVTSADKVGTFILQTGDGYLSGLQLRTISVKDSDTNDLIFDTRNTSVRLRIETTNGTPYYQRIANSDTHIIPNIEYLQKYVASSYTGTSPFTQGQALVSSMQYPVSGLLSAANSSVQTGSTTISFYVAQTLEATVNTSGLTVGNVNTYQNTITNNTNNLVLASTQGVEVSGVLNLDDQSGTVTYTSGKTKIYSSSTTGPGKTGIYFANTNGSQTPDELISRRRAVLLSILL